MGLMVAANKRFAEFDDSVMVRGLGVQKLHLSRHRNSRVVAAHSLFIQQPAVEDYPQHECLQSHFRSVTFLLSSHI